MEAATVVDGGVLEVDVVVLAAAVVGGGVLGVVADTVVDGGVLEVDAVVLAASVVGGGVLATVVMVVLAVLRKQRQGYMHICLLETPKLKSRIKHV